MSSSGLTRRRGAAGGASPAANEGEGSTTPSRSKDNGPETSYENGENGHKIAFDPRDMSESAERSKQPKLTMMEEILLLGLKDKQVRIQARRAIPPSVPIGTVVLTLLKNKTRDISLSGTTTFPMHYEDALSWNWLSVGASAWKRTPRDDDSPLPIATLKL